MHIKITRVKVNTYTLKTNLKRKERLAMTIMQEEAAVFGLRINWS